MSAFCFCGVCIPYSAIWPFVLLLLQPIYNWARKALGYEVVEDKKAGKATVEKSCCSEDIDQCAATSTSTTTKRKSKKSKSTAFPASPFYYDEDMDFKALEAEDTVFYKFTAEWCKPCKQIEPLWDKLAKKKESKNAHFVSIDIDEHDSIASDYGVTGIPLFIAMKKGKEHDRLTGSDGSALESLVKKCI